MGLLRDRRFCFSPSWLCCPKLLESSTSCPSQFFGALVPFPWGGWPGVTHIWGNRCGCNTLPRCFGLCFGSGGSPRSRAHTSLLFFCREGPAGAAHQLCILCGPHSPMLLTPPAPLGLAIPALGAFDLSLIHTSSMAWPCWHPGSALALLSSAPRAASPSRLPTFPDRPCQMYVPGKLSDVERVLIDVGTGYYVEKVRAERPDRRGAAWQMQRVPFGTAPPVCAAGRRQAGCCCCCCSRCCCFLMVHAGCDF